MAHNLLKRMMFRTVKNIVNTYDCEGIHQYEKSNNISNEQIRDDSGTNDNVNRKFLRVKS